MNFIKFLDYRYWNRLSIHERLTVWHIYDLIAFVVFFGFYTYFTNNVSPSGVMFIPTIDTNTSPEENYANNTLFGYPIKLSGQYCSPTTLYECIQTKSTEEICCKELFNESSYPEEEVSTPMLIVYSVVIPVILLSIRQMILGGIISHLLRGHQIVVSYRIQKTPDWNISMPDIESTSHASGEILHENTSRDSSRDYYQFEEAATNPLPKYPILRQLESFVVVPNASSSAPQEQPDSACRELPSEALLLLPDESRKKRRLPTNSSTYTIACHYISSYFSSVYSWANQAHSLRDDAVVNIAKISNYFWLNSFVNQLVSLGLALLYEAILVDYLKVKVSSPRPNYYSLQLYSSVFSSDRMSYSSSSHKSFPSGHASTISAGMGYLALVLSYDAYLLNRKISSSLSRLLMYCSGICFIVICWVGATRIRDYWHFAQDVITGWIIGIVVAYIAFVFITSDMNKNLIRIYIQLKSNKVQQS